MIWFRNNLFYKYKKIGLYFTASNKRHTHIHDIVDIEMDKLLDNFCCVILEIGIFENFKIKIGNGNLLYKRTNERMKLYCLYFPVLYNKGVVYNRF